MGYRIKIGKVSKADHLKYKDLTEEEFYKLLEPTAKWDEDDDNLDDYHALYFGWQINLNDLDILQG